MDDTHVREFEYKATVRTRIIRNVKLLDYVYYAKPGTRIWKKIRWIKIVLFAIGALEGLIWPFVFLFLDPSTDVKLIVEVTALVMSVVFLILTGIIFANIDVVALRLRTLVFFVDLTSTVLVVAILLVYGQGFSLFGVSYLIGSLGLTYLAEGMELGG